MRRSVFIIVAAPLVLAGCSYSPSTGWHRDDYSEPDYAVRSIGDPQRVVRSGYGFSPHIDVCNFKIDGVSVCAPR